MRRIQQYTRDLPYERAATIISTSDYRKLRSLNAALLAVLREVEEVLNVNPAATEHLSIAVARNVRAAISAATGAK